MKLRRAVIELELLYDEDIENPLKYDDLRDIAESTLSGHVSGDWQIKKHESVSKKEMARLLRKQGSDPEFLLREDV